MKSTFILINLLALTLSNFAFAQAVEPAFSQPPGLDLKLPTTKQIEKISKFLIRRLRSVDIDGFTSQIPTGESRKFVAGFSVDGAVLKDSDFKDDSGFFTRNPDYAKVSHFAGGQIIPFEVKVNADGSKQITASAFSLRDMNSVAGQKNHEGDRAFKFIDRIDLLTISWDQNHTFRNLQSIDVNVVSAKGKYAFAFNGDGNYLAVTGGTGIGLQMLKFDRFPAPFIFENDNGGFLETARFGLEGNIQSRRGGFRLNAESHYEQAHSAASVNTDPGKGATQIFIARNSGYLKSSVNLTHNIIQGKAYPVLGVGAEYNRGFYDQFSSEQTPTIDLLPNFKQVFNGKLFIQF